MRAPEKGAGSLPVERVCQEAHVGWAIPDARDELVPVHARDDVFLHGVHAPALLALVKEERLQRLQVKA